MTGKRSSRRAPGLGRSFSREKAPSVSERQAHFMPRHAAVGRVREPLILKTERFVPGNEFFLAGEHHAEAAFPFHVSDELSYERAGEPPAAVRGIVIHPAFLAVPLFVGGGLVFAGLTGFCGLGELLKKLPWNVRV